MPSTFVDVTCLMISDINAEILSVAERISRYSRLSTDEQDALSETLTEAIDKLDKVSHYLVNELE